jgi:CHAT domain-containing protein
MRKILLLLPLLLSIANACAQNTDSLTFEYLLDSLLETGIQLRKEGKLEDAVRTAQEGAKIVLDRAGEHHAKYTGFLHAEGVSYSMMGKDDQALPILLRAKDLRARTIGKNNRFYWNHLVSLAIIYNNMDKPEEAEVVLLEWLTLQDQYFGTSSKEYCSAVERIASHYLNNNQFVRADSCFKVVIDLLEKAFGSEYKEIGRVGVLRGVALRGCGRLEAAEHQFMRSVHILGKEFGELNGMYQNATNFLAMVYAETYRYDKAEEYYQKALKAAAAKGEESEAYATVLDNLSNTYSNLGNLDKALIFKEKAVSIMRKKNVLNNPFFIRLLLNLANTYNQAGQKEKATSILTEAVEWHTKATKKDIQNTCITLVAQGISAFDNQQFERSVKFLEKGLDSIAFYYGKDHFYFHNHSVDLLNSKIGIKDFAGAEALIKELHKTIPEYFGKSNELYIRLLSSTINYYFSIQSYESLPPYLAESAGILKQLYKKGAQHLSEKELSRFYENFMEYADQIYTFSSLSLEKNSALPCGACMDLALFNKGFLLTASLKLRNLSFQDTINNELYKQLLDTKRHLSAQYAQQLSEQHDVDNLESRVESLEKKLAATTPGYKEAFMDITWEQVQQKLPKKSCAIEWVRFNHKNTFGKDSALYAAIVITPSMKTPLFVPLIEETELSAFFEKNAERNELYVKRLYTLSDRSIRPIEKPKRSLYEMLWKPLEPYLSDIETIYFAPSGLLHRMNVSAIPVTIDSVLADYYQLIELNSTRQLIIPDLINANSNDAFLFGGVDYESDSSFSPLSLPIDISYAKSRGAIAFQDVDSTLVVGRWDYLPFTEREVTSIHKIMEKGNLRPNLYQGSHATEAAFKSIGTGQVPSPRVIHLATHGYFFPDPGAILPSGAMASEPVYKQSNHPFIRSGLLLAGANHSWQKGGSGKENQEDGILTAYEISQMHLANTELVVLSACETGLGDIQGNEGVYGLQRAFKIAGVKYIIMSLWQVPDKQTSLLMTSFYKKWLEQKMTIPEAFRAAQQELRMAGLAPFQWAGFILLE